MMVGFEDTTENKKWLVPQRNKNIQCFFSDSNKSEHQDKCLGWRMLTSSIGSSETQLTLKHTPKDFDSNIIFINLILFRKIHCSIHYNEQYLNFCVWTKKCSLGKLNWLEDDLSNTFLILTQNFLQTTINKKGVECP